MPTGYPGCSKAFAEETSRAAWSLQGSTQVEQHYKPDHRLPEQDPNFALEFCGMFI
jgi:hypothetical protein